MISKLISCLSICVFLNFLIACASLAPDFPSALENRPEIVARELPEVILQTSDGKAIKGKIQSLEGNHVKLMPHPYWNVDPIFLNLNELSGIESKPTPGAAGKGFLWGFVAPFMIVGLLGIATSEYNDDYSLSLMAAGAVGFIGGLIGALISAADTKRFDFEFEELTPGKKKGAITKIMGY